MIVKVPGGYRVVSHQTGRSFGTYQTRGEAEARLAQIERYSDKPAKPQPRANYRRAQHPNN